MDATTAEATRAGAGAPEIRRITVDDVRGALREGLEDFLAKPSHTLFLVAIYPVAGLVLTYAASNADLLPLMFPLIAGFALIGPIAAIGLYELSRRRERGETPEWRQALAVLRGPSIGGVVGVAVMLVLLFLLWLRAARAIFEATMGPEVPGGVLAFFSEVLTTEAGWTMIVVGNLVGLGFAIVALSVSVLSLPLLVDGERSMLRAVATSIRGVAMNPVPMAAWGLAVAVILAVASIPAFVGLAVALPVLGHATWRLYKTMIVHPGEAG